MTTEPMLFPEIEIESRSVHNLKCLSGVVGACREGPEIELERIKTWQKVSEDSRWPAGSPRC